MSKNQAYIGIGTDGKRTIVFTEGFGKVSGKQTLSTFKGHIKEGSKQIHEEERGHRLLVDELALQSESYNARLLKGVSDRENPLQPINRKCFTLLRLRCADNVPVVFSRTYNPLSWNLKCDPFLYDISLYGLVDNVKVQEEKGDYRKEVSGRHELEFIETVRYTTSSFFDVEMTDSVQELNLVEGRSAMIESLDGSSEPFEVHYAETFIIPSSVKSYRVRSNGGEIKVVCAFVRQKNYPSERHSIF